MALHPDFSEDPYQPLVPSQRWFPADESLREKGYSTLIPPLVSKIREEVYEWRNNGYPGCSPTTKALLNWWFETPHFIEEKDGTTNQFRYYFAQREAVESVIWLYEVRKAREKFDLMRFDSSGAVSAGMFPETWPRYVTKMATGSGKTKVISYHLDEKVWQDLNDASHTLSLPKNRIIENALGGYLEKLKDEQEALGKPWLKAQPTTRKQGPNKD